MKKKSTVMFLSSILLLYIVMAYQNCGDSNNAMLKQKGHPLGPSFSNSYGKSSKAVTPLKGKDLEKFIPKDMGDMKVTEVNIVEKDKGFGKTEVYYTFDFDLLINIFDSAFTTNWPCGQDGLASHKSEYAKDWGGSYDRIATHYKSYKGFEFLFKNEKKVSLQICIEDRFLIRLHQDKTTTTDYLRTIMDKIDVEGLAKLKDKEGS